MITDAKEILIEALDHLEDNWMVGRLIERSGRACALGGLLIGKGYAASDISIGDDPYALLSDQNGLETAMAALAYVIACKHPEKEQPTYEYSYEPDNYMRLDESIVMDWNDLYAVSLDWETIHSDEGKTERKAAVLAGFKEAIALLDEVWA